MQTTANVMNMTSVSCNALSRKRSKTLLLLITLGGCATASAPPTQPVDAPPKPAYIFDQSVPYQTNPALNSTLTIYVYPPSDALDWTNPKTAFVRFGESAIREKEANVTGKKTFTNDWGEQVSFAYGYCSTMGHTIAHIQCQPAGETAIFDKWASLSGQDFREVDEKNARDEIGLSVLFYNYTDGFIIAGQENRERLSFYRGERRDTHGNTIELHPRYVSFNIDAQACKRLKDLEQHFERYHYPQSSTYEQFLILQRNPTDHLYFSTNFDPLDTYLAHLNDPLTLEGGGCAPFGVSLIRAAGVLVDQHGALDPALQDNWKLQLEIGQDLLGGPDIKDAKGNVLVKTTDDNGNERRILVFVLLGTMSDHWTEASSDDNGNPNKPVRFSNYDPQRLWDFVGDVMTCLKSNQTICSPIAKTFLSSSYLNGRKVKVGKAFLFTDRRFFKDELGEIIEVFKETGPLSPGLQPLNNLVEGVQVNQ
jgi:hypothetical protein